MKKLANLKGAEALSKKEQKSINGGGISCRVITQGGGYANLSNGTHCAGGTYYCCNGVCVHFNSFSDYIHTCEIGPVGPGRLK